MISSEDIFKINMKT